MRSGRTGLAALVLLLGAGPGALAQSQSDIVWPTYDLVERSTDVQLDCAALSGEISHVVSDVSLLNRAKTRIEEMLHSAFDMERYAGSRSPDGGRISSGGVGGKEAYAAAREQIVASLKVALARRDHLKSLEPACKPGPQPVAAP